MVIGHSPLAVAFVACAAAFAPGAAIGAEAGGASGAGRSIYLFRDSLWSANPEGAGARPITKGMPVYAYAVTVDGARVAFAVGAWRGDRRRRELVDSEVWVVNADGTALHRVARPAGSRGTVARVVRLRWSPDGWSLAFDVSAGRAARGGGGTLYVVRLSEGKVRAVAREPVQTFEWTPDGRIKYRPAIPGEEGGTEWLVSPVGAPRREPAPAVPPRASEPPAGASRFAGQGPVAAAPPPLPPGAILAQQPPSPPSVSPATPRPPLAGSGAGGD